MMEVQERFQEFLPGITTVLFDLDGTLLDSREMLIHAAYQTAMDFQLDSLTPKHLLEHFGTDFSSYLSEHVSDKEKMDGVFTERKAATYHLNSFFSDVHAGLARLIQQGIRLGIVTNQKRELVLEVLRVHELEGVFEVIVTKDDVKEKKPSAEPIRLAMDKLGVDRKQVLMVGDTRYDFLSAKRAGVEFALVHFYETVEEPFMHPCFTDFYDLVEGIIQRLGSRHVSQ